MTIRMEQGNRTSGSTKRSPPVPLVNSGGAQWRPVYSGGVLRISIVSTYAPLTPTGRLMTPHDAKKAQGTMYLLNLMRCGRLGGKCAVRLTKMEVQVAMLVGIVQLLLANRGLESWNV